MSTASNALSSLSNPKIVQLFGSADGVVQIMWLGHYRVQFNPSDNTRDPKVSIIDTRTHEGGSFSLDAFSKTMEDALDTFFMENF
jgi:hypothetical protein